MEYKHPNLTQSFFFDVTYTRPFVLTLISLNLTVEIKLVNYFIIIVALSLGRFFFIEVNFLMSVFSSKQYGLIEFLQLGLYEVLRLFSHER